MKKGPNISGIESETKVYLEVISGKYYSLNVITL